MHAEAMEWIVHHGSAEKLSVLDIGGRNINGTARDAWPNADPYVVLDIREGDGVDIVADAATWTPDRQYDVVVCAEVFEHTADWPAILRTMFRACKPGGQVVLTMAGPGREPHSAVDGCQVREGEWYKNVSPHDLWVQLWETGFQFVSVNREYRNCDVRAFARRPLLAQPRRER